MSEVDLKLNNVDVSFYWANSSDLNMKEFHYVSPDLVFVAYYTLEDKIAFVFNNTIDSVHAVKKLIIDPLQSEIDIEQPIIKWDQIVKEHFNIDPMIIRPKNGNLYEKFDIDYVGLKKYDELVRDPQNSVLRKNLIVFDVKRNLNSAYKKEEIALLELNTSSKTVESTTKTLERIDNSILNLNKRLERFSSEEVEDKEDKLNELNDKLYKKLASQKNAKRRLKRAKSRYVKADKIMSETRIFLKNALEFLKNNKVKEGITINSLKENNSLKEVVEKNKQVVAISSGIKNNSISEKNDINTDISKSIKTVLKKDLSVPNWKKSSDIHTINNDSTMLGGDINNKKNHEKEGVKISNLNFDINEKKVSEEGYISSSAVNIPEKLMNIKNRIVERVHAVNDVEDIRQNVDIVKSNSDMRLNENSLKAKKINKIIVGTLGDFDYSANALDKSLLKNTGNSNRFQKDLIQNLKEEQTSTFINVKIDDEKNGISRGKVFRYSSSNNSISKDVEFDKFKKNLIVASSVLFVLLCLLTGYFVLSSKSSADKVVNIDTDVIQQQINSIDHSSKKDIKILPSKDSDEFTKSKKDFVVEPMKLKSKKAVKVKAIKSLKTKKIKKNIKESIIDDSNNDNAANKLEEVLPIRVEQQKDVEDTKTIDKEKPEEQVEEIKTEIDGLLVDEPSVNSVEALPKDMVVESNEPQNNVEAIKSVEEVKPDIADISLSLSGNSLPSVNSVTENNVPENLESSDDLVNEQIIPNQFGVDEIKYDSNLISAREQYISEVIGYNGSVNRPMDIMMALGEAIVNQNNDDVEKYMTEIHKMNAVWNNFRKASINSYYMQDNIHVLKNGIVENEEIYNLFIDDEKLLRVYADAHQTLFLIVRYMLDNYTEYIDEELFDQVKLYASTPEMLGYPIKKTRLIIDVYDQIYGKKPQLNNNIKLPTNEEINNLYANRETTIDAKKVITLKNVNNPNDTMETEVALNNIKVDKEYQIRVGVKSNINATDPEYSKKEIINMDIDPVDGVKGTYILDGAKNYRHGMLINTDVSDSNNDKNINNNYLHEYNILSISLAVG